MVRSSTISIILAAVAWWWAAGCIVFPDSDSPQGKVLDADAGDSAVEVSAPDGEGGDTPPDGDVTSDTCLCPLTCEGPCLEVTALTAGGHASCVVMAGKPVCWGSRQLGGEPSLGLGPTGPRWVAIPHPTAASISTGDRHTCVADGAGEVHCWGNNSYRQVTGNGARGVTHGVPNLQGASTVHGGGHSSCAVVPGTGLLCWGLLLQGAAPDPEKPFTPGLPTTFIPEPVAGVAGDVDLVALGTGHGCAAVMGQPEVYCWGSNAHGQLGVVEPPESAEGVVTRPFGVEGQITALAASPEATCAVDAGISIACWGSNRDGLLGVAPSAMPESSEATVVAAPTSAVSALDMGDHHACVLSPQGVVCWGGNDDCQLGFLTAGATWTPQTVEGTAGTTLMATGGRHTCAMVEGRVVCWGADDDGQLGKGTYSDGGCVPHEVGGLGASP